MVSTGTVVKKTDLINQFNSNVIAFAYSGTPWSASNVPVNSNKAKLIPDGQLDTATIPYISSIGNDTIITASTVVSILKGATSQLTRIRNCTVRWYFKNQSTFELKQTSTNKAIFKSTTPTVSGSTEPYYTKSPNITNMLQNINPASTGVSSGQVIAANTINNFINNLKNSWQTVYNNAIQYNYYTCHSNCDCWCFCNWRGRR